MVRLTCALLVSVAAIGCGRGTGATGQALGPGTGQEQALTDVRGAADGIPSGAADLLVFALGGHNSCISVEMDGISTANGNVMVDFAAKLATELTPSNSTINLVATCFGKDSDVVYYASGMGQLRQGFVDTDDAEDFLASLAASAKPKRVLVVGHSYGGWLAMKSVPSIAAAVPQTDLVTIDPISLVDCNARHPRACRTAPPDIDTTERDAIRDDTAQWINFFQTETRILHSSPMSQATENIQVAARHTEIDHRDSVWTHIRESLKTPDSR